MTTRRDPETSGPPRDGHADRDPADPRLRQGEQLARMLLDAIEARAVLLEEDGTIVDLNEAAASALGSSRERLVGACGYDLFPDDLARVRREAVEGAIRDARPRRVVDVRDGRTVETIYRPIAPGGDARPRVVVFAQDVTARARAEETLQHDAKRLRGVIENLQNAYFQSDASDAIVMANPAAAHMFGYASPEALVGTGADLLWTDPVRRTAVRDEVWRGTGRVTDWVEEGRRRDGSTFWGSIHGAALRDDAGRIVGMEWVVRDVTERREALVRVQQSEAQLRAILDNLKDAYIQVDPAGRIARFSPSATRMYGYSAGELTGLPVTELYADPERRAEFLAELERHGHVTDFVALARTKDGTAFWVSMTAHLRRAEDGDEIVEAVVRDVTQRKLAEERLLENEGRLRRIIENLQDAFFQADAAGRITVVSPSAARMYGYGSVEEMIGLPAETFYADTLRRREFLEEARGAGPIRDWIGEARRKDGSTFWVSMSAQLIRDPDGNVVGSEGLVRDITDRKRAEAEHLQVQASLAQSDRLASMGMLAAGVAHEINNPLSYVLYNLESLAADLPRLEEASAWPRRARGRRARRPVPGGPGDAWADVGERLRNALEGTVKIRDIARGLRTFSRVETDAVGPVDLRLPIESALAVAYNEIKYRARLDRDLGATAPVLATEGKLSQVFLNLFINAAQAIREGDVEGNRILVRTRQVGAAVRIEVLDTGCGIAPANLPRIFDPFFTTKPIGVGSGLGLSIVRNIVTSFGGTIDLTSEVGKGTRFVVELPIATGERAPGEERRGAALRPRARGRLLVVDDEAPVRYALKRLLRTHEVVEADSGEAACRIVGDDPGFDVVLCDMMMPSMTGVEFHRWLLANHPALAPRVLFVTGGAFTPAARDYLQEVENLRVEKPFDSVELPKLVAELVRAARAARPRAKGRRERG